GTNWVKLLAMAMIGLPKSASFMPVARQSPRAPAMLRPWVVVLERYFGMRASSEGVGNEIADFSLRLKYIAQSLAQRRQLYGPGRHGAGVEDRKRLANRRHNAHDRTILGY